MSSSSCRGINSGVKYSETSFVTVKRWRPGPLRVPCPAHLQSHKVYRFTSAAMLWHSSHFLWSFLYLLTLDRVYAASDIICAPGEKATRLKNSCEPCPANQYNSKSGSSKECRNCEPCGLYSDEVSRCTPKSNTKCHCYDGFIPFEDSMKNCKCPSGSGIKTLENGKTICRICPPNSPTNQVNTPCLPQYVENIPQSTTFNINCRNDAETVVALSSRLPHSQPSASTTSTPTTSRYISDTVSSPTTTIPELNDNRKHALWLAPLAALLLLILLLKLSGCPKKKTEIVQQGSACRKPVEESGEKFIPPV